MRYVVLSFPFRPGQRLSSDFRFIFLLHATLLYLFHRQVVVIGTAAFL